ncbi:MAG: type II toxin-antitoxin system HicB family antitoxin [Bacteroidetes bacterium]|nr:MAG: type II toxin-antitoxin system HicB family antitoxin [Bacteroidota bacterium]
MKSTITAEIYHDGEFYCAKCLDFDIFTQGKSLDDVVNNLKEAVELHFLDSSDELVGFTPHPSLFTLLDLGEIRV